MSERQVILATDDYVVTGIPRRWWERTYAIPRWLVWISIPSIAIHAVLGIHSLVVWFS